MIAGPFRFEKTGKASRFEAEVQSQATLNPRFNIRFEFHSEVEPPEAVGDAWLAALLVPAMFAGESLEIRAPVTRRLTRSAREIQRLLHCWYPDLLSEVEVITPELVKTGRHEDGGSHALFFSGGVDSWYSLDRRRDEIAALITVKGFDLPSSEEKIWGEVSAANGEIASGMGLQFIRIETNIRERVDPGLGGFHRRDAGEDFWGSCYHGACLAAAGLFLQQHFSYMHVPASWQYGRLQPWGSHPLLDGLWSNGRLDFVHDGAEATRLQKIRRISAVETALRHLRVCPVHTHGLYNCGICEKCRRTLLALRLFDVKDEKLRFDRRLDLEELKMNPPKRYLRPLYRELLEEARAKNDVELIRCLRVLTGDAWSARYEWKRWISRMRRSAGKRMNWLRW